MRNRMSPLDARNKQRVGEALDNLSRRIGFRISPGLSERVIYRELFPMGLSLLDLTDSRLRRHLHDEPRRRPPGNPRPDDRAETAWPRRQGNQLLGLPGPR